MPTVTTLPKIIRFTRMYDGGPTDGGRDCVLCPHCGAKGRYIYYFQCDDGTERGAMSGCIKLFPTSRIALEHKRLLEKQNELRQRYGRDAHLNSWDTKILEAIESYYAADTLEDQKTAEPNVLRTIDNQKAAAAAYRQRRYGRR